jgi:hypothetical protein
VVLHIAAVLYYRLRRRQDLLGPMIHGDKVLAAPAPASRDDAASRLGAAVVLALAIAAVTWLVRLGLGA